jgi:large conductance mechanosensitive channel
VVKEFRDFILRGNVLELAVAVIIGVAFGAITDSLVKDVITPIIAAFGGAPNFSALVIPIGAGQIKIGNFLNAVLNFLIIAAVLFFLVVKPMNMLTARRQRQEAAAPPPPPPADVVLLGEIRDLLKERR